MTAESVKLMLDDHEATKVRLVAEKSTKMMLESDVTAPQSSGTGHGV